MIIDCTKCPVRGQRCDDCAVTVLLAPAPARNLSTAEPRVCSELLLDAAESRVVSMFVGAGLVNAGAATMLRARREKVQHFGSGREVG